MPQALYRKWRPKSWDEVIGQEHIIQTLRNAVAAERVAHAYLFSGPRGTGKTTTARLLAKAVNCLHPDPAQRPCNQCAHCQAVNEGRFMDLIEIDAASNTGVDDIRELRDKVSFAPSQGRYKVYIIDEVHMLSTAAFNALLKTLEEPPAHAIFILATTEIHKIPPTVLSRCQRYEFRRIPVPEIAAYLRKIVEGEGLQAEDAALTWVARQATGSLRDAISLLDQLASSGKPITLELARAVLGTASEEKVLQIAEAVANHDVAGGLEHIHAALDAGADPRQLARQIVSYLRQVLLAKMGSEAMLDVPADWKLAVLSQAEAMPLGMLLRGIEAFERAATESRAEWHPSLPLEIALVEATAEEVQAPQPVQAKPPAPRPIPQKPKPQPQAQTAPAANAPIPATAPLTLEDVATAWKGIFFHLDSTLRGLLNQQHARPVAVEGQTVVVGLSGHGVSASLIQQPERKAALENALRTMLDRPVSVRFKISPAAGEVDVDLISQSEMARTAVELGGKVVKVESKDED